MRKFLYDPEAYREKPVYGLLVEGIKDAKTFFKTSRAREVGQKEIDYVSDFLEARLEKKLGLQLSSVIFEKCQTIDDMISYIRYVSRHYGVGFYFDKTKMRK